MIRSYCSLFSFSICFDMPRNYKLIPNLIGACFHNANSLPYIFSATKNRFLSSSIMSISVIFAPFSDKIQERLEHLSCSMAVWMSSSMVFGIHNTTPCFLFSSGSQGWNGKTVHFLCRILSAVGQQMALFSQRKQ